MDRLIIKFPFQSVNDEQYVLVLHHESEDNDYFHPIYAMQHDNRCFKHIETLDDGKKKVYIYEGTLCGSVKAEDDSREDMFTPLASSKLSFNMACQDFPDWLMNLCNKATSMRVVLYTVTDYLSNPLRERWRGYLQCNTLNMTVVNDLLACPLVAVDEIGVAKQMPFRDNCSGQPAHLSIYYLFKKWWSMHWTANFNLVYSDLGLATNQAAMYWFRDMALIDDYDQGIVDVLNNAVINLSRYYNDRKATWENVLEDVCAYLGVHFTIGGYSTNEQYDNYILTSYDSGAESTIVYNFHTDAVVSTLGSFFSQLGNQQKIGADLQITYTPDKYKGVKVKSTPERMPMHEYLLPDNVKEIQPLAGANGYAQVRMGQNNSGHGSPILSLKYWRLQYLEIVSEKDQWTEESEYITLRGCNDSPEGRDLGREGYFPFTDADLGQVKPRQSDTDSIEFALVKKGMIPVKIGGFEYIDPEWPAKMTNYLMLLNNVWGRKYWDDDNTVNTDISTPFKVADIHPFGPDGGVKPSVKSYLKIDFSALITNENIAKSNLIFEADENNQSYTNLLGRNGAVFPMTETFHDYTTINDDITGRLGESGRNYIYYPYAFLLCRLRIGNYFWDFDIENNTAQWVYCADPSDGPTFRMPILGDLDKIWYTPASDANVEPNYYYSELRPKSGLRDTAFIVPIDGISVHGQPLQGKVTLEIWWPTPYLNYYLGLNQTKYQNNILSILINDIKITFTDDAEIAGEEINVVSETVTNPSDEMKTFKEIDLNMSTPGVDGVFANCLLYDGGKLWHNLQLYQTQDGNSENTPEKYLSEAVSSVYSRPQVWVEFNRMFSASNYGNIANHDFRVSGLTETPGVFVPVERKFEFTKGWVRWKMQKLSNIQNPV